MAILVLMMIDAKLATKRIALYISWRPSSTLILNEYTTRLRTLLSAIAKLWKTQLLHTNSSTWTIRESWLSTIGTP